MTFNIRKQTNQNKWQQVVEVLTDGLSENKQRLMRTVLESTRKDYVNYKNMLREHAVVSSTSTGNIATLNKVVLPILRRVLPNVIANELIGVQPLPGPVAQIATLKTLYGNNSADAGVSAGEETLAPLHVRDIAAAYSGNERSDAPGAGLTAQLESNPGNTVSVEILKQTVEAKSRKLSARWTHEAQADAQNQYQIDLEQELMAQIAQLITVEIDQEILRSLRKLPPRPTAANTFDQAAVSGQATSVVDEFAALSILMRYQAHLIATRTRRGSGNWAVISPTLLTVLESARASAFARTTEGTFDAPTNVQFVGTLNNSMKIYTDVYAPEGTDILIGYKGSSEIDAATFYCPYVPLTTHGVVVDPNTFDLVTSFYTRYAYVEFVNTSTSLGNSADYLGLVGVNAQNLTFF